MIVVHPGQADAARLAADAYFFGDVFEFSVALVVEETNAVGEADGEIRMTVVVEVTGGAAQAHGLWLEPVLVTSANFPLPRL